VRGQSLDGRVLAGEFGFREYDVDLLVARSTEENDGMAFGPAELPARACSFVEGSWDEMVSGEARRGTPTKGRNQHFSLPQSAFWTPRGLV
jgi:hypothetical protein